MNIGTGILILCLGVLIGLFICAFMVGNRCSNLEGKIKDKDAIIKFYQKTYDIKTVEEIERVNHTDKTV